MDCANVVAVDTDDVNGDDGVGDCMEASLKFVRSIGRRRRRRWRRPRPHSFRRWPHAIASDCAMPNRCPGWRFGSGRCCNCCYCYCCCANRRWRHDRWPALLTPTTMTATSSGRIANARWSDPFCCASPATQPFGFPSAPTSRSSIWRPRRRFARAAHCPHHCIHCKWLISTEWFVKSSNWLMSSVWFCSMRQMSRMRLHSMRRRVALPLPCRLPTMTMPRHRQRCSRPRLIRLRRNRRPNGAVAPIRHRNHAVDPALRTHCPVNGMDRGPAMSTRTVAANERLDIRSGNELILDAASGKQTREEKKWMNYEFCVSR